MKKTKNENIKKFSLDDFKTHAKTIASSALLETITGGVEDACHIPPAGDNPYPPGFEKYSGGTFTKMH